MHKIVALIAFSAFVAAGPALADGKGRWVEPSAPQAIFDVMKEGRGTVVGTVTQVGANWFRLSDGTNEIDVTARHFLPESIRAGDPLTVTGYFRRGAIHAGQIILADGSVHGPNLQWASRSNSEDDDD